MLGDKCTWTRGPPTLITWKEQKWSTNEPPSKETCGKRLNESAAEDHTVWKSLTNHAAVQMSHERGELCTEHFCKKENTREKNSVTVLLVFSSNLW